MPFPSSIPAKELQADRATAEQHALFDQLHWLYSGGEDLLNNSHHFLVRRTREPQAQYELRRDHLSYNNIFQNCVGFYESRLFERQFELDQYENGSLVETDARIADFRSNCDRRNTPIVDFIRQSFIDLATFGQCAYVIDVPVIEATNRLEEQIQAKPYLVRLDPRQIVRRWTDEHNRLERVVFRQCITREAPEFPHAPSDYEQYWYFNRDGEYAIYERKMPTQGSHDKPPEYLTLLRSGTHALGPGDIPVRLWEIDSALWLGRRVFLPARKHLNVENALDWALFQSAVSMLVVKGTLTEPSAGPNEWGWIQLKEGGDVSWAEPSGNSFGVLMERAEALREDIYRLCYLISIGRSSAATPAAQSGHSKEIDIAPAVRIANRYAQFLGNIIRQAFLDCSNVLRMGDFDFRVRGFLIDAVDIAQEIDNLRNTLDLQIPSETFRKMRTIEFLMKAMPHAPEELRETIKREIEASKSPEQIEADRRAELMKSFQEQVGS